MRSLYLSVILVALFQTAAIKKCYRVNSLQEKSGRSGEQTPIKNIPSSHFTPPTDSQYLNNSEAQKQPVPSANPDQEPLKTSGTPYRPQQVGAGSNPFTDGTRLYNFCPPTNYDPMFLDGAGVKICLVESSLGTIVNGGCSYFCSQSQTKKTAPASEVICHIENHKNLKWTANLGEINLRTQAITRVYITDTTGMTPDYFVCRASKAGQVRAGWARRGENKLPSSPCYIDDGAVETGVEYLIWTTDIGPSTLWDKRAPIDVDPAGGILAEGLYALTPTIDICEYACTDILPQCRAYLWYVGSGQCWLKIASIVEGSYANKEGTPDPTDGARGRIIPAKPTYAPELTGFKVISDPKVGSMITSGAIIEGAHIQMFGLTLEQCGQKCREKGGCIAIVWRSAEWECFLFKSDSPIEPDKVGDGIAYSIAN